MNGVRAYSSAKPQRERFEALVSSHAELVRRIAYHLAGRLPPQIEVQDLMQAGMIGLLEAAQHYSGSRGAAFETYAGIRIRGAMLDALRKLDWAPRSVHRKARAVAEALRQVEARRGAEATDAEIAEQMGVSIDEYHKVVRDALCCQLLPLNDAHDGEESTLERLPDAAPTPEAVLQQHSLRQVMAEAIKELPQREQLVLSLYYEQELSLKEIGVLLKVTESRVCQLHGRALLRLRAHLADWNG